MSKPKTPDNGLAVLPLSQIRANPLQPRRRFDQERLQELADSIQLHGVVQPVVVTREAEGYRLVVGERRGRASRLAGLQEIPALIQEFAPQNLLEVALIENLQRQDLNPVEEARAFQFLLREHKLTQDELALFKKADGVVTERLRRKIDDPGFLKLDPDQKRAYFRKEYAKASDAAKDRVMPAVMGRLRKQLAEERKK